MSAETEATHFDVIVLGTGLRESILAAALAKWGRTVLHVDEREYYGAEQASLNARELHEWATRQPGEARYTSIDLSYPAYGNSKDLPAELSKASGRYNFWLSPSLVPANCPFVDALIRSGVHKYTNFKLLDAVALYNRGRITPAAATKADIFNDRDLSLIDKRKLMKFLLFAASDFESSSQYTTNGVIPLKSFLSKHFGLQDGLSDMILYAAALSATAEDPAQTALLRLRKYLKSAGRFGRSPFLLAEYGGTGELIQSFCRVCAVFGGTYMLRRKVTKHLSGVDGHGIEIDGLETYTGDAVVRQLDDGQGKRIHRAIVLLSCPIRIPIPQQTSAHGEDEQESADVLPTMTHANNAYVVFPPKSLDGDLPSSPVTALLLGPNSLAVPQDQYILHLSAVAASESNDSASQVLQPCLKALLAASEVQSEATDSVQLVRLFFTERFNNGIIVETKGNASATTIPLESQMSVAEWCDEAVRDAGILFQHLTGEAELFEAVSEDVDPSEE